MCGQIVSLSFALLLGAFVGFWLANLDKKDWSREIWSCDYHVMTLNGLIWHIFNNYVITYLTPFETYVITYLVTMFFIHADKKLELVNHGIVISHMRHWYMNILHMFWSWANIQILVIQRKKRR